ncbi:MAG: hypothetical protein HYW50_02895 [Candidatus Diapherotrites archaeon]|nr:hypothetical protein [Candidatus Diapherotrites archaeon]
MSTYKHHLDLASERFELAKNQFEEEKFQTASHLFINAVINYHNAICQKFLQKKPNTIDTANFLTTIWHNLLWLG